MSRTILLPPERPLLADGAKAGGWWHTVEDGRMVCDLCPRACNLKPGDRGFCFVRENRDGEMVLTTYGRSTGFCVDPIEKKPLNHFLPGTSVLSFGTAGCNLGCKFCQNHDISKAREVSLLSAEALPETIQRAAVELGCHSVAYTYNDPVIWAEYAVDTARVCRAAGIKSVAVTAGYITPAARGPFFEYFDAANVDLKAFTEAFYQQLTLSHLQPVLDTIAWLKAHTDVWVEITNLVIPGANDSQDEIRHLCDWILQHAGDDTPVHFTAFHPDFKMLDRPRTPRETLLAARELAISQGLKYVYVGNVDDETHQSTYCPGCGQVVIQRNWYQLGAYRLRGSQCGECGTAIAGRFLDRPGTWGRRRLPIRISQFAPPATSARTTPKEPPMSADSDSSADPKADSSAPTNRSRDGNDSTAPTADRTAERLSSLTDEQRRLIHTVACEIVASAIHRRRPEIPDATWGGTSELPVLGAYVSLKRQARLRSCCGFIGRQTPMAQAVWLAAERTALEDYRLPPISPSELECLDLEVWLLHGWQPVTAAGTDRIAAVEIGKHGLQIGRGDRRGLLLPGVAVEHGFDSEQFLRQVCLKAGLPSTAWRERDTELFRFEGLAIHSPFAGEAAAHGRPRQPLCSIDELRRISEFCRDNTYRLLCGGTPNHYLPGIPDGMVHVVAAELEGDGMPPWHFLQYSWRPGLPLQATLYKVAEAAAASLRLRNFPLDDFGDLRLELTIGLDPAMHGTFDSPDLRGVEPSQRALLIFERARSAMVFDPGRDAPTLLDAAAEACYVTRPDEAAVYSVQALATRVPFQAAEVPHPQTAGNVRPAAVAGTFYPADAAALDREVDRLLPPSEIACEAWWAAVVPHAGLTYSGHIAAEVLAHIQIPETVLVIGPKHTRLGVDFAVAPHQVWSMPGFQVASDPELASLLAESIPLWQLDAAAHQREHAIEVELPFLHRAAPQTRVVGVALGPASYPQCQEFARALATALDAFGRPVLLLISSDMNHFAPDAENRRLDAMALSALEALDPAALYSTCREHQISMCGMVPAVVVMEALRAQGRLTKAQRVAYATSADVTGDTSRVVGYAGVLLR